MTTLVVHGVEIGGVRSGDVFTVLRYVATVYDATVGRLVAGQCGGYNPRSIAGSGTPSNHASATAIDLNWTQNPEHKRTMTAAERAACHAIVAQCGGVVRWGGDYSGADVDEMHWEINKPAAAVAALAREIEDNMDVQTAAMLGFYDAIKAAAVAADADPDNGDTATGRQLRGFMFTIIDARLKPLSDKLDQVLAALATPPAE